MKFKLFGRSYELRAAASQPPVLADDSTWSNYLAGAGYTVSSATSIRVAAVFRCVDLLSKTMATLPLHLFEQTSNGKERAYRHPLYSILLTLPNEYTTAYDFWQMFVTNLLLTRGAFAKIERTRNGAVKALWNIPTSNVSPIQTNKETGERYIEVTCENGTEKLYPGEYLYVPGFRLSSDTDPMDPMTIASNVIGLSCDMNGYAAATFRQGTNPGGFVEVPSGLSDLAYARMKEDFAKNYAGVQNAGKYILLEEGAKAQPFNRDMTKTQALESRKFMISEICRVFGVPPHLCMDMENATFSNIEQQSLEFVRDAINPLSVRIEQAIYKDCLTASERKRYFVKFNVNALLRGDTAARTQYYNVMRQNGVLSADDIRELEDMNRIQDGLGQTYYINGNMLPLEFAKENKPKSAQKGAQT